MPATRGKKSNAGRRHFQEALGHALQRGTEYHGVGGTMAIVTSTDPLAAELIDTRDELNEDELNVCDHVDTSVLEEGDVLVLLLVARGTYATVGVQSDRGS